LTLIVDLVLSNLVAIGNCPESLLEALVRLLEELSEKILLIESQK